MHGVIVISAVTWQSHFHPSLHIDVDGELHQFDGITHIAELH
jgi:hypothetical protein